MLIKVKVGKVELEYSEPTETTNYPKVTSKDKFDGLSTKHDALMKAIKEMADKAAELHVVTNLYV